EEFDQLLARLLALGIVEGAGNRNEAVFGELIVHLDQMREFFLASDSGIRPEIDDDDLALVIGDGLDQLVVLDELQRDLVISPERRRSKSKQAQPRAERQTFHLSLPLMAPGPARLRSALHTSWYGETVV